MTRAQDLFGTPRGRRPQPQVTAADLPPADHANREGAPAYSRGLREEVLETLMTGTFGPAFYATARDLADRAIELFLRAADEDPGYLARAAVYAREKGFMRLAPITALVALSRTDGDAFCAAFDRIVRNADDLRALVAVADGGRLGRTYGGRVQRAVARWLDRHLDEYQAMKYLGSRERYGLRNILRMSHPRPSSEERAAVFRWVVRGEVDPERTPRLAALEGLAEAPDPAAVVERYGLPFEAVTPRVRPDPETWTALIRVAPYLNLVRTLNTFGRHAALRPEAVELVVRKLTDREVIHRAKVWPFQIWQATEALEPKVPGVIRDALYDALEVSTDNLPDLSGHRVVIAPDISASMRGTVIGRFATAASIAGIFAGAVFRATRGTGQVIGFENGVRRFHWSARDTLASMAREVTEAARGGTWLGAPVDLMIRENIRCDLFLGITDSEDWSGWSGRGDAGRFITLWRRYRSLFPGAQAVLIQLVNYRDGVVPEGEPGVHYVYGWSPDVLRYVAYVAEGGRSQLEEVEAVQLG